MVWNGEVVVFLHKLVHSSFSSHSNSLIMASFMSSWPNTASAMDAACPPRRNLTTLLSAGPKSLVYGVGWQGVLTVTYDVSGM